MDVKFKRAVERTLTFEGGYANDPADPGGETNFGISARAYPHLAIKALTRGAAEEIYYRDYWLKNGHGEIADAEVAAKVFDLAVNMGPHRAHILLQEAVNRTGPAEKLVVDGNPGAKTLRAVNNHPDANHLLAELKLGAVAYYLGLKKPRFLAGWIRRALA
jgi:lysozyme family protein